MTFKSVIKRKEIKLDISIKKRGGRGGLNVFSCFLYFFSSSLQIWRSLRWWQIKYKKNEGKVIFNLNNSHSYSYMSEGNREKKKKKNQINHFRLLLCWRFIPQFKTAKANIVLYFLSSFVDSIIYNQSDTKITILFPVWVNEKYHVSSIQIWLLIYVINFSKINSDLNFYNSWKFQLFFGINILYIYLFIPRIITFKVTSWWWWL